MNNQENIEIPKNILLKRFFSGYSKTNPFANPSWLRASVYELFNYVRSTDSLQHRFLEIEVKLGFFSFEGHCKLYSYLEDFIKLPKIENDQNNNFQFNSYVSEGQFYSLWSMIEEECKYNQEILKIEPINSKEIIYQSGKRKSTITTKNGNPKIEIIIKQDKYNINIRNNKNDMRISICKEFITDITSEDIAIIERNKFRVSYQFRFFRLDFSIVNTKNIPDDFTNNNTFEIEFELNDIKTLCETTKNFTDYESFEILMRRYIENILCFYYAIDNNTSLFEKGRLNHD